MILDGCEQAIVFASRTLSSSERKYTEKIKKPSSHLSS